MTSEEQELLEKYLSHLNVLGEEGTHPNLDCWYLEVRYARGPGGSPHPAGGLGAALQGRPRRRPGVQTPAGYQFQLTNFARV